WFVRYAAHVAASEHLPPRPKIPAERTDRARDRRAHEHATVPDLSPYEIRRALSPAAEFVLMTIGPHYSPRATLMPLITSLITPQSGRLTRNASASANTIIMSFSAHGIGRSPAPDSSAQF